MNTSTSIDRRPHAAPSRWLDFRLPSIIVILPLIGCGSRAHDDSARLSGRVVIDGVPVEFGGIQFMPLERGRAAFAEVRNGDYAARVPRGRVRAIFSSRRETGRQVQVYSEMIPEVVDTLPPALRDGIEITVESDDPARDFLLSSKQVSP